MKGGVFIFNTKHNIFYIGNAYADIVKIIEKYNLTYGDWDCLQNLLEYGIASSCKSRAEKYPDLINLRDTDPDDFSDEDLILYGNIISNSKYPLFDQDDYFIKNPYV